MKSDNIKQTLDYKHFYRNRRILFATKKKQKKKKIEKFQPNV